MAEQNEPKKVIIDEDWKNQAQKQKEELKEEVEKPADESASQHRLPPATFEGLISVFATQAYYSLGLIRPEDEKDQEIEPDFELAKFNIDILGVLEAKCKGNLTEDEAKMLQGTLGQLRMIFVQLMKK